MVRLPRIIFDSAIYHVTVRGNSKNQVFYDGADFRLYLKFLKVYKQIYKFKLYAYCLMPNHVHLLVETVEEFSISTIMKVIRVQITAESLTETGA